MFKEEPSQTTRAASVERTYLDNKAILVNLLRSQLGDNLQRFIQDEVTQLGPKDTETLFRRLVAGISRDDTLWDQDRRDGALTLLPFIDYKKLRPGQIAIPYINAIQSQDANSDPYGPVDGLLKAGAIIIPQIPQDSGFYPDILNDIFYELEGMTWRLEGEGRDYAKAEENKLKTAFYPPPVEFQPLPKEMPMVMKTGAEVLFDSRDHLNLSNLLEISSGDIRRVPLKFSHVQQALQEIISKPLPDQVINQVNLVKLKRWEAIWDPNSPSILFLGSNEAGVYPLDIKTAIGTIFVDRKLSYLRQNGLAKVGLDSVLIAGMFAKSKRIIEFSYGNPNSLGLEPEIEPGQLRLEHVGFSVSQKELQAEDPRKFTVKDEGVYWGNDITDQEGRLLYTPHYYTFPVQTEIDQSFHNFFRRDASHGSVITEAMQKKTAGHIRQVRTKYEDWLRVSTPYRLYLGGEKNDPLMQSGFYSYVNMHFVRFGKPSKQGRHKAATWEVELPINI